MSEFDLPDVNVLIALVLPEHVHHQAAREWFRATTRFVTTPITETGFVRVALNPAISAGADSATVFASLRALRQHPKSGFLVDDSSLADPAIDTVGLLGHKQVTDLHLVNLAVAHGGRLVTFDRRISGSLTPRDAESVFTLG